MKEKDKVAWREKNLRVNSGYVLKIGDRVIDEDGYKGVIVKLDDGGASMGYEVEEIRVGTYHAIKVAIINSNGRRTFTGCPNTVDAFFFCHADPVKIFGVWENFSIDKPIMWVLV